VSMLVTWDPRALIHTRRLSPVTRCVLLSTALQLEVITSSNSRIIRETGGYAFAGVRLTKQTSLGYSITLNVVTMLASKQVGDPLKDTSGPSLNILIKLMAVESLVFAPFFANCAGGKGLFFHFFGL